MMDCRPLVLTRLWATAGFAVVAGIALLVYLWRRETRRRLQRKLSVVVQRDPARSVDRSAPPRGLLSFLEIDPTLASSPSLRKFNILAFPDYVASLHPTGAISVDRAIASAADRWGLAAALPLAMFFPAAWQQDAQLGSGGGAGTALLRSFPGLAAARGLGGVGAAFSVLDLVAFSQAVQQSAVRRNQAKERQEREKQQKEDGRKSPQQQQQQGGHDNQAAGSDSEGEEPRQQQQLQQQQNSSGARRSFWPPWRKRPPPPPPPPPKDAATRAAAAALTAATGPLDVLLRGAPASEVRKQLYYMASPVSLDQASVLEVLGLTPEQAEDPTPAPAPLPPKPVSKLLPDLFWGNNGLPLSLTPYGAGRSALMASICNRLCANALEGLACAQPLLSEAPGGDRWQRFEVTLEKGDVGIDSLEGLVEALVSCGHSVTFHLLSNLTSFGIGLSVRETTPDGSERWQQIPIAYPLRTGLWACDEAGRRVDVHTMMSHASIIMRIRGPLMECDLEWCLGVEGFTGWLPYIRGVARPWASGPTYQIAHPLGPPPKDTAAGAAATTAAAAGAAAEAPSTAIDAKTDPAAARHIARLLTAGTAVLNCAGQRDRLLFGGYGYLGVCIDSAAAVQQAVAGVVTLYPLLLAGDAKSGLVAQYRAAAAAAMAAATENSSGSGSGNSGWAYAKEASVLASALVQLPSDVVQEPSSAAAAARRALACLPRESVFAAVQGCRAALERALAAAEEMCAGGDCGGCVNGAGPAEGEPPEGQPAAREEAAPQKGVRRRRGLRTL